MYELFLIGALTIVGPSKANMTASNEVQEAVVERKPDVGVVNPAADELRMLEEKTRGYYLETGETPKVDQIDKFLDAIRGDLRTQVERGDAKAEYDVALVSMNRPAMPKSMEIGAILLTEAANQGFVEAEYALGELYNNSDCLTGECGPVRVNRFESRKWLEKAARSGHLDAAVAEADLIIKSFRSDYSQAMKQYQLAAEKGHRIAEYKLGLIAESGQETAAIGYAEVTATQVGEKQDYAQAFRWHSKAAEQGFWPAQLRLGSLYCRGLGTEKNYIEAAKWYLVAEVGGEEAERQARGNLDFLMHPQPFRALDVTCPQKNSAPITPVQMQEAQARAQVWLRNHSHSQ